jgi:PTH1 family peptidyl-tRNA hydrolase
MRVIAGLGNPGRDYDDTRHNLGFMLIDRLFARAGGRSFRAEANALIAEARLAGERVILVKPQTFMNLSGDAVKPLLGRYGEGEAKNLIVTCDDVALPLGMIRVRPGGSAGGQKGLKSIIDRLGTDDFPRVRVGIRPDHPVSDLARFVLAPIPKRDREQLDGALDRAADAVEMILSEGIPRAMSAFNERVKPEDGQ